MVVSYPWFSGQSQSSFHLVFSWEWLGLDDVLPSWVSQILGHLGIFAWASEVGVMVGLGLYHRQGKMVFLLWQGWVLLCSLWEHDWYICPIFDGSFSHSFMSVGLRYFWKTSNFLLLWGQYGAQQMWSMLSCWSTWSMRWFLNSVPLSDSMNLGHMWTGR